jgi:hypothetical protein
VCLQLTLNMQRYRGEHPMFDINNMLTNKVVNIILLNIVNITEVTLLRNDCNKQESLTSESVTVIRINLQPCNGNHQATQHMRVTKAPRVTTICDAIKESGRVLPHSSACLPCDTSMSIRGWPMHYPDVHPRGVVGYHLTR